MVRRKVGDQDQAGEAADFLSQRPEQRDRSWESEQRARGVVVTYRGVPADLQARIKEIAGENKVKVGELARRFLEYALAAYESGELDLDLVDVATKRTLYPDD